MTKLGISLPIYNTPLTALPRMAKQAEDAGFDSVWSYEIYSNPYIPLAAAALATERIGLGTAIAHASTRSPWVTANFSQGAQAVTTATHDRLVDAFAIWGEPEECREKLAAYEGRLPHVMLHPPSIPPASAEDTADTFQRILETFGR